MNVIKTLFLINTLICIAFIAIIAVVFFSFQYIEKTLITTFYQETGRIIQNSNLTRELSRMLSDLDLVAGSFYGKDDILHREGEKLVRKIEPLTSDQTDDALKRPLFELKKLIDDLLRQCRKVNAVRSRIADVQNRFDRLLTQFDNAVADKLVKFTIEGRDASGMRQLSALVGGFRETMMRINLKFERLGLDYFKAPLDPRNHPLLTWLEDIKIRLGTLSASDEETAGLGQDLIRSVSVYEDLIRKFHQEGRELGEVLKKIDRKEEYLLSIMEDFDRRVEAKTNEASALLTSQIGETFTINMFIFLLILPIVILGGFTAKYALRESEELYRITMENLEIPVFITDDKGNFTFIGENTTILGFSPEEIREMGTVSKLLGEALFDFDTLNTEGVIRNLERGIVCKDGRERHFLVSVKRVSIKGGTILYTCHDITARKKAQDELKDSEELYRVTMLNILFPVFLTDDDGQFTFICPNVEYLLGYTETEIQKMGNIHKLLGGYLFPLDELKSRGMIRDIEKKIYNKNGRELNFMISARAVSIRGGTILYTFNDITALKQAEDALEQSAARLRAVFEAIPAQISVTDTDFNLLDANVSAEFLSDIGFSKKEDIIGRKCHEILKKSPSICPHCPVARCLTTGEMETWVSLDKGAAFMGYSTKLFAVPMFDKKRRIIGAVGCAMDISDLRKMEEELRMAKDAAESANQAKSHFLANMSHEIRTPMNAILGFADLLTEMIEDEQQKNYLTSIRYAGKNLLNLINDILDLSKIEAGKMRLHYEPVSIVQIIEEMRSLFRLAVSEKAIDLIIEIPDEPPAYLMLDEIRVRQVLINLISNAVKFTDKGHVKIIVETPPGDDTGGPGETGRERVDLIVHVLDTGAGISSDVRDRLFDIFEQGEERRKMVYGGTGLGLAISRRLMGMMNGSVSVQSIPLEGSVFTVRFRDVVVADPPLAPAARHSSRGMDTEFEPATILLVDDDRSNRNLINAYLRDTALSVIDAENGHQAVRFAEQYHPDVILMDIRMPVMDGCEAARRIKERPAAAGAPPIIGVTAFGFQEDEQMILESGFFDGYIRKPVQRSDLLARLSSFLKCAPKTGVDPEITAGIGTPLDIPDHLSEIVDQLENELMDMWEEIHNKGAFSKIMEFANRIKVLGAGHSFKFIENYGEDLLTWAKRFDVENIQRMMNNYPEMVLEIKNSVK